MVKKILTCLFTIALASSLNGQDISREEFKRKIISGPRYQDIFFEGEIISTRRVCKCENRYEIIKSYCQNLPEPFSILDLGAAQGYFCFRLTSDFNAQATAVECSPTNIELLTKLIKINQNYSNVILEPRVINRNYLERIVRSKAYDVVIATNIIHHLGGSATQNLRLLSRSGKHVFCEIPVSMHLSSDAIRLGGKLITKLFRRDNNTLPTELFYFENDF